MKIKTWIKYMEGYLPTPRCRKLRYKECEDFIDVELKEVTINDVKLALRINSDYSNYHNNYYLYNDNLYVKCKSRDIGCYDEIIDPIENLKYCNEHCSSYFDFKEYDGRQNMIEKAQNDIKKYLLIDDVLYRTIPEPVYALYCFGVGNNHSSTSLLISDSEIYKWNCGSYFNALDREKAVDYAINVAIRRGDTNSIEGIKNTPVIEVLLPDVIKVRTQTNN